jgi:hypothetical protein
MLRVLFTNRPEGSQTPGGRRLKIEVREKKLGIVKVPRSTENDACRQRDPKFPK